jgi:MFS transporter, DHA2 family, multidrug resistance protein
MEVLVINSAVQGFAVGVVWVPITAVAFGTLDPKNYAEASAVFHLLRNIGSSFFISLCVADIISVSAQNYSRMTEMISPFNERLNLPWVMGGWTIDSVPGLAQLSKELIRQAALIGYLNAFAMYTAASGAAVLLILLVRRRRADGR